MLLTLIGYSGRVLALSAQGPGFNPRQIRPRHTKDVKNWCQWFPCLALNMLRETLALSEIANSNNTIFEGLIED